MRIAGRCSFFFFFFYLLFKKKETISLASRSGRKIEINRHSRSIEKKTMITLFILFFFFFFFFFIPFNYFKEKTISLAS